MLLTLIVGLAVGWWLNDREQHHELLRLRAENVAIKTAEDVTKKNAEYSVVTQLIEAAQASDSKVEKTELVKAAERALFIVDPGIRQPWREIQERPVRFNVDTRRIRALRAILKIKLSLNDVHE